MVILRVTSGFVISSLSLGGFELLPAAESGKLGVASTFAESDDSNDGSRISFPSAFMRWENVT